MDFGDAILAKVALLDSGLGPNQMSRAGIEIKMTCWAYDRERICNRLKSIVCLPVGFDAA